MVLRLRSQRSTIVTVITSLVQVKRGNAWRSESSEKETHLSHGEGAGHGIQRSISSVKKKKRKEILFSKCFTKKEGRRRGERQICLDPDGVRVSTFRKLSFLLGFAYLLRQDLIM